MNCQRTVGFYNKWLRSQSSMVPELRNSLTISMLSLQELQSVLEQILRFEKATNYGKVEVKCLGTIKYIDNDSEEMSS